MKIVVAGTRGIPNVMGGVETHCEELFPRVVKRGYDVIVIRRKSYARDTLTKWKGVSLVDVKAPRQKSFEAIIHTFRALLKAKRLGADVLHIHAIGPALLVPFAKLLGMKVVFTHHGPDYARDKWGKPAKMMLRLGERVGCKYADDVIVISDVIRNLIADNYGRKERVHLIYNGVPEPNICEYPEYFEDLDIEKGKYILGMCRFVPEKNLHHLVEAFSKLGKENDKLKGVKLVLAGDTDFEDEYSRKLKEDALRHGVVLAGFVKGKKLQALLSNARCYCLPSSHEGLPIALLEAMSYRLPVVVSDIPANLEVGLDSSCYFPVGDVEALTQKLKNLVEQDFHRNDYDLIKYDWEHIADQVSEVYAQRK